MSPPDVGYLVISESVLFPPKQATAYDEPLERHYAALLAVQADGLNIFALDRSHAAVADRFDAAMRAMFVPDDVPLSRSHGLAPSSGTLYALWLLPLCERLDLYGFNAYPERPAFQGHFDGNAHDGRHAVVHNFTREGLLLHVLELNSPRVSVRR